MAINRRPARRGGASEGFPSERWGNPAIEERRGDIAGRLRALYAEAEQEPLPARLIELLERLDRAESEAGGAQQNRDDDASAPSRPPGDASEA